jgi:hypothetical protein
MEQPWGSLDSCLISTSNLNARAAYPIWYCLILFPQKLIMSLPAERGTSELEGR